MIIKDKKIVVIGYGVENEALVDWLLKHDASNITICDKDEITSKRIKGIKYIIGKDYLKNLDAFDVIFRTPGISPLTPEIVKAKKKNIEISSQIKLFLDLCPCKTIGITGTKGKGTTSTLIYDILKEDNIKNKKNIYLAGNIGTPPIKFLDKLKKDDLVILELSSFQLMDVTKSPNISVVLDVKIDHMDYHKSKKEYIQAKENIVRFQTKNDYAVLNLDSLTSINFASVSPTEKDYYFSKRKSVDLGTYVKWPRNGYGVKDGDIILRADDKDYSICKTNEVSLRGLHNLENITAAITASYLAKAKINSIKKVVKKFKGLEHRLELVRELKGVKYYNDSFSTTPDTAIAAINSFKEPIVLIVGGSEKGADYKELGYVISHSTVKTIISIGITGPKIIKYLNANAKKRINIVSKLEKMKDIVQNAYCETKKGDVVLLSPASASFGLFENYKDRGNQFKENVSNL